jgi:hypothetical protein
LGAHLADHLHLLGDTGGDLPGWTHGSGVRARIPAMLMGCAGTKTPGWRPVMA